MKKLSKKERDLLKLKYDGRCSYCGELLGDKWHVDHFKPVKRRHELYKEDGFSAVALNLNQT